MKLVGWLLAGGVGLYLLDKLGYLGQISGTPAVATSTSPQANDNSSSGTGATSGSLSTLMNQVNGAATLDTNFARDANGLPYGTPYHWAFYLTFFNPSITSVPLGQLFPGIDLNQPMSQANFWAGVSGYLGKTYGLSGLGMIAHHVNPYTQGPRHAPNQKFGAGLAPIGVETYIYQKGQA
jgi:hypothetical protein